jgi:D-sedoheptulose 7-phosphate isomerase
MQIDDRRWLEAYFRRYQESIFVPDVRESLIRLKELLAATRAKDRKAIIVGNGGSAAIASHCALDFTKQAGVRCISFNQPDLITCFANDYGYEHWVQKALESYADEGDTLVLVSSSGKSPNMLNAARFAASRGLTVVTFTGFAEDNPLKQLGQLNFWVNSRAYNIVETTHQIWLLAVCDLLVGNAEYSA